MSGRTIGVTGAAGFLGQQVALAAARCAGWSVAPLGRDDLADAARLSEMLAPCDAVVHLAGVNRGSDDDLATVNRDLARRLIAALDATGGRPHVVYSSSTQETAENVYGQAKRAAGDILSEWAERTGAPLSILVIPNVFGPGCRPFYNSVVATFCHQLAHGETPTVVHDRELELIYVGDLADEIVRVLAAPPAGIERRRMLGAAQITVSELLATLRSFRESYFEHDVVPDLSDGFRQRLFATFLSYLPPDKLRHCPPLHSDPRGSLVEVIRLAHGGQVFFSTTRPGVVRGDHYHTRKVEWFCVLQGEAVIRLRRLGARRIEEFRVSGSQPQFISIPVMHTHHIENVGDGDLLTMFWCNEIFNRDDADTYFEKVA